MTQRDINLDYFDWLSDIVCGVRYSPEISYSKLLMCLHNINFTYLHPMDENRAEHGANLRYRFALMLVPIQETDCIVNALSGPCSVLEMMIALADDLEMIMDDPRIGNRTAQWFWSMVASLGLSGMYNEHFDARYVNEVIDRFLNRDYAPNGKGGLFTIRHYDQDMRKIEIWWQACAYLNSIM